MVPRYVLFALLLALCTVAPALAAGTITIQSPTGSTLDPASDRFSFSTDSGEIITSCGLFMDGNLSKTATYNTVIKGRSIGFAADIYVDGDHTWRIECNEKNGFVLSSADRHVTIAHARTPVNVIPSGAFRGSMLHEFTMMHSASQEPIVVDKVAAGDYVGVTLKNPPSKVTKELYVKSRLSQDGVPSLWITYKLEDYHVALGENVTIPIDAHASVILGFQSVDLNRATLVVYPNVKGSALELPPASEPAPQPAEEIPTSGEPPAEAPSEPSAPSVPDESAPTPAERPGAFQRFVDWLVRLFGA